MFPCALLPLAAVLLSILLALLVVEGLVRVVGLGGAVRAHLRPGIFRADPELGWALASAYRGMRVQEHRRNPTSTNALGFRGPEWDAERSRSELRLLVLGDSCTFGLGVADDETFPAQLERLLRARGLEAAVFNAGPQGPFQQFVCWSPRQRRATAEDQATRPASGPAESPTGRLRPRVFGTNPPLASSMPAHRSPERGSA